jgi:hypothetical protein
MQDIYSALFFWQGSAFCLQFLLSRTGLCFNTLSRGSECPQSSLPACNPADSSEYSNLSILYEDVDWIQMTESSGDLF